MIKVCIKKTTSWCVCVPGSVSMPKGYQWRAGVSEVQMHKHIHFPCSSQHCVTCQACPCTDHVLGILNKDTHTAPPPPIFQPQQTTASSEAEIAPKHSKWYFQPLHLASQISKYVCLKSCYWLEDVEHEITIRFFMVSIKTKHHHEIHIGLQC